MYDTGGRVTAAERLVAPREERGGTIAHSLYVGVLHDDGSGDSSNGDSGEEYGEVGEGEDGGWGSDNDVNNDGEGEDGGGNGVAG